MKHLRNADDDSCNALVSEALDPSNPYPAGQFIASLVRLVDMILTDASPDPDAWLDDLALRLAMAEADADG